MARGSIKQRADGRYIVWVYAGRDPLTGKERRLTGTALTMKEAEKVRTRLLAQVDERRAPRSNATVAQIIQAWLDTAELEQSTRDGYQSYIDNQILPALGKTQARKVDVETLERFYAQLRKSGGARGRPLSASTVRQIHFILRASYGLQLKWGRLTENPAALARPPRFARVEVTPPTVGDAQRLLEAARNSDPDFGALLRIVMITGMRRAELCALRWSHVRLESGELLISRSYVQSRSGTREKDTKTHQSRLIALDPVSVGILTEHRDRCRARAEKCETTLRANGYVFSPSVDGSQPLTPASISQRFRRLTKRLGIEATIQSLRHFMGTMMLTAGTDLRTVAGRLGHADGGSTTLRVYTHFLPAPDRRATERLAKSLAEEELSG